MPSSHCAAWPNSSTTVEDVGRVGAGREGNMKLDVNLSRGDAEVVVDLRGQITVGPEAIALRRALDDALAGQQRTVSLNLERVSYLDSAGLAELVAGARRANDTGITLRLLKPSRKVSELLRVTRLEWLFGLDAGSGS